MTNRQMTNADEILTSYSEACATTFWIWISGFFLISLIRTSSLAALFAEMFVAKSRISSVGFGHECFPGRI